MGDLEFRWAKNPRQALDILENSWGNQQNPLKSKGFAKGEGAGRKIKD